MAELKIYLIVSLWMTFGPVEWAAVCTFVCVLVWVFYLLSFCFRFAFILGRFVSSNPQKDVFIQNKTALGNIKSIKYTGRQQCS